MKILGDSPRFGAFRRTALVGVATAGAFAATAFAGTNPTGAQTAGFNNGTGSAVATSLKVNPIAGGLSFGLSVGESLAGHQNTVATAESRSANLGVIGVTLGAPGCDGGDPTLPKEDQPQPLRTSTGEEGAEEGISSQDSKVPGVDRFVRANADPFAETITTTQGIDIPGVLSIGPSTSRTTSGVFGDYREATAVTEFGTITLGGVVTINGLRWEAVHHSDDAGETATGSFTMGSATGPLNLPIPTDDAIGALTQMNAVLAPFGLRIDPPSFHVDTTSSGTLATVDPLAIALVPGPLRDSIIQPVISGLQPVRDSLFDALIEATCDAATGITILDILLNSTGPGGQLRLELGGVQAASSPITLFSGLGQLPPLPPLAPATPPSGSAGSVARPTAGSVTTPARPATAPAAPAAAAPENPVEDVVEEIAAEGERGGAMLAVGLGGLGALLAAAEGDRRKMRRAQREIPLEA